MPADPTRRDLIVGAAAALALGCPDPHPKPVPTPTAAASPSPSPTTTAPPTPAPTPPIACEPTSRDAEGPYWLPNVPIRSNLDLYGDVGIQLAFGGAVLDTACTPVADAIIEIWHADPSGAYDNETHEMRYRGQQATDADGLFQFATLQPGKYPGRPLHIHVKVWVGGAEVLTTQVYFADDPESANERSDLRVLRIDAGPNQVTCSWDAHIQA